MCSRHGGKRRNCLLHAISPFLTVFSKDFYRRLEKQGLLWERVNTFEGDHQYKAWAQCALPNGTQAV